jgi:4-amino-4-deoxy-L-arabinose transferase-like glycosyltransferase
MKTFFKILAWFGLCFILPGLIFSYSSSSVSVSRGDLGSGIGYAAALLFGAIGTVLALIGRFISRPDKFWIALIVVGIAYIASFYGFFADPREGGIKFISASIVMSLPGIVCIIGGIIISKLRPVS